MRTWSPNISSIAKATFDLLVETGVRWSEDNAIRLSGALSFFAILSIAPLLVLAVTVAGLFLGNHEAFTSLHIQVENVLGRPAADLMDSVVRSTIASGAGAIATIISLIVAFFSASNLFIQLDDSINTIWRIKHSGSVIKIVLTTRIFSFIAVIVFGALIVAWLIVDSWLFWLSQQIPIPGAWRWISLGTSFLVLTCVFAGCFHAIPRTKIKWSDVFPAALLTALGFSITKWLLGEYFAAAKFLAAYGAAGSLVVMLLWLFYTSQIFFFGVELSFTYAHAYGSLKPPKVQDSLLLT